MGIIYGIIERDIADRVCAGTGLGTLGHLFLAVDYVGKSIQPKRRLGWHQRVRKCPLVMLMLERPEDLNEAEQRWICELRELGAPLENKTRGGNGSGPKTPETRAKMSVALQGRILSPETRAKMSEARRGNQNSLGHKRSPETCAKVSAAMQEWWAKPENRAKVSEGQRKRYLNPAEHEKISAGNRRRWAVVRASRQQAEE